jgi:hypothetical protein
MGVASLYTKEVAKKVRELKPPMKGIKFEIVDRLDFVTIRIYEKHFQEYSDSQRVLVIDYLMQVRVMIESFGIRCEFEGVAYNGS